MRERGIIFSAPMIRAILAGRKTQTRRVLKGYKIGEPATGATIRNAWKAGTSRWVGTVGGGGDTLKHFCPYGFPGDRLWVRETWANLSKPGLPPEPIYRADTGSWDPTNDAPSEFEQDGGRWCPSIRMPRWASRILLEITEVRVERVQDISREDAKAEGFLPSSGDGLEHACGQKFGNAQLAFRAYWDSLQKDPERRWDANPFVWVIKFRVLKPEVKNGHRV